MNVVRSLFDDPLDTDFADERPSGVQRVSRGPRPRKPRKEMLVANIYEEARADERKVFTRKLVRWLQLDLTKRRTPAENAKAAMSGAWLDELSADAEISEEGGARLDEVDDGE